jgi:putative transposase
MYDLDKSRNAVYSLQYHLISTVKYRQKVFTNDSIISELKTIIEQIAKDFEVDILECECGDDHIHILFRSKPTLDITKFINILKGHSSRHIRKTHKEFLSDKLWGDSFWSPSYFLSTVGNVTIDILKKYIENQRELSPENE